MKRKREEKLLFILMFCLAISLVFYSFSSNDLGEKNFLKIDFKDQTNLVKDKTTITAEISREKVNILATNKAIDLISGNAVSEIEKVDFKIDGIIYKTDTQAPYSIEWVTTDFSNGEHEITAVVTYVSGRKESSAPVRVTVDNAVVPNAICGNNIKEGIEICDGTDLDNKQCTTFSGYTGGNLKCKSDCKGFDFSQCTSTATTGNTYYVSTNGNDANTCLQAKSISTPKRTISEGIKCLAAGDTLLVRSGTYAENVGWDDTTAANSGTSWSQPVTLRAYPSEIVRIRPNSGQVALGFEGSTAQYIIVDGLIIDGTNINAGPIYSASVLGFGQGTHHIRIMNSEIVNMPGGYGVQVTADYIEFINNKIHDSFPGSYLYGGTNCGQSICWGYPFYWEGSNGLIEGNEIYDFPSWGIHMYSSNPAKPNNNIIRNNKIHDFSTSYWPTPPPGAVGAGDPRGTGILLTSGTNNIAYNNIVYRGSNVIALGGSNTAAYNNIVYGMNGEYGGINTQTGINSIVKNNIFFGSSRSIYPVFGSGAVFSNNLCDSASNGCTFVGDPKVVNFAANDFHLQSTSPAINTGVTLTEFNKDFDGKTRPQGTAWDIGAYEYTGTTTTTPPPTTTTSVSLWDNNIVPALTMQGSPNTPVELGVKFKSDVAGSINGIKFYKSSLDAGNHIVSLWDSSGNLLAQTTSSSETSSGWQQVNFANPVSIQSNTVYTASYHSFGYFAVNTNYLTNQYDNSPLHALVSGGVYQYSATPSFPIGSYIASNYWVDVLFSSSSTPDPSPTPTTGNTYYVATNGNDANTCLQAKSISTPKRTIPEGIKCLNSGETLLVRSGIYDAPILKSNGVLIPSGTSWSTATTIKNYPGEVVTNTGGGFEFPDNAQYIIIDGINIDGANSNVHELVWLGNGMNHIRFANLEVKNAYAQGILTSSNSGATSFNEFINLKVYNNGHRIPFDGIHTRAHYHGIYLGDGSCNNCLIENSEMYDNSGGAIQVFPGSNDIIIRNNKIYGNSIQPDFTIFALQIGGARNLVYNNIFYENMAGIGVGYGKPTNIKIFNNVLYNNNRWGWVQQGIVIGSDATGIEVKNNIVYQHNFGDIVNNGVNTVLSNNLAGIDPKFVSASTNDFKLQSTSPAIDKGLILTEVPKDFDGKTRPIGTAYDIGAYER